MAHGIGRAQQAKKIIVPFPPGAANDTIARLLADAMGRTGSPWIIDNRAGAGSLIGMEVAAKSPGDGNTLMFTSSDGLSVLPAVRKRMPVDVFKDFRFLARVASNPFLLAVNPQLPVKSLKDFIELSKRQPIRVGNTGNGTLNDIGSALLASQIGAEVLRVPYKGMIPSINDLIAGHIDAALISDATAGPFIASGKLRAVAVLDTKRSKRLPEVPNIAELGYPKAVVPGWWGILGPATMPEAAVIAAKATIESAMRDPQFLSALDARGFDAAPLPGDAFLASARAESAGWKDIAEKFNISVDE